MRPNSNYIIYEKSFLLSVCDLTSLQCIQKRYWLDHIKSLSVN